MKNFTPEHNYLFVNTHMCSLLCAITCAAVRTMTKAILLVRRVSPTSQRLNLQHSQGGPNWYFLYLKKHIWASPPPRDWIGSAKKRFIIRGE